jgi:AAA domain
MSCNRQITDPLNPEHSVLAWGPPGSGKTHLLVSRVIRLLLQGADPAKIICVKPKVDLADYIALCVASRTERWNSLDDEMLDAEIRTLGVKSNPKFRTMARQIFGQAVHGLGNTARNSEFFSGGPLPAFDHLLIDEAECLSSGQNQMIAEVLASRASKSAPATKRTVFVVGDSQQSIFSMRGRQIDGVSLGNNAFHPRRFKWSEDNKAGRTVPPPVAECLMALLAPKRKAESILGDLEERFQRDYQKLGKTRANSLYWARTIASIAPLVWSLLKRIGVVALLIDVGRRWLG